MFGVHFESIFQLHEESIVFKALYLFASIDIYHESKHSMLYVVSF